MGVSILVSDILTPKIRKEIRMNKKVTKVMVISLLLSLLTGCFPSGELEQSSPSSVNNINSNAASEGSDNSAVSEPVAFTVPNDLKNVKFNFEPNGDYPSEVPVIKAKYRIFDIEKIKAMFIDDKTIVDQRIDEYSGYYVTSAGESLSFNKGKVSYLSGNLSDDAHKKEIWDIQSSAARNLRFFYKDYQHLDSELEGFSRAEALERADKLVKELDIKFLGEPSVYAFTAEDVENVFQGANMDKDGNDVMVHLSKEDEFYLVRYYGEYNGITMPGEIGRVLDDQFAENTQVDVVMTKDCLVKLECDNVFDSIEAIDTTQIKCGIDAAISKAHDYYSFKDRTMDYQLEYDSIGISYVTYERDTGTSECKFKPLWHLSGTQYYTNPNGSSGHTFTDKFVDPATGLVYDAGL